MTASRITRLSPKNGAWPRMSSWTEMALVGEATSGEPPKERFHRAFDRMLDGPAEVRAGIWEATPYGEKVTDYPYNEIVFVVAGRLSIIDDGGHEECFEAGDCFFLEKGFAGTWHQHDTVKIFHMTVDPKGT